MMKRLRVYIAGPISGRDIQEVRDAFGHAERQLKLLGFKPVNPARHIGQIHSSGDEWGFWMRRCIAELVTCNAIYLLDGWQRSRGCRLEHKIARELGLAILRDRNISEGSISDLVAVSTNGRPNSRTL